MSGLLLTGPAGEPISLAEAKAFLRIEHDDDDDVITALISGARIYVEAQTRRALITQSWRLTRDTWPPTGRIAVRPGPLQSLAAARVYDGGVEPIELDVAGFFPDVAGSELVFAPWVMPAPGRAAGIELDVTVGFGDAAVDVPEPLRQAIRLLAGHWYENRGLVAPGTTSVLPLTVPALLAPYRMVSL
ncbi:MAG TPA: head-tail connector protein [Pseudolabrys sp.]|nr:head-tail connector protein [Pseudolabrys sp.]